MRRLVIRRAESYDAEGIARVCAAGWRDTYRGMKESDRIEAVIAEYCGRRGFAARIPPRQSETDEEQQPDERSSEWQKTIETIGSHTIPLGRISATL